MASATASSNRRSSPKPATAALILALLLALVAGGCGGGSDSSSATAAGAADTATAAESARPPAIAREESEAADKSIQRYGSEADGDEKAAVVAAMRSFFRALAKPDYAKLCAGLSASNREQLQQLLELKHEGPADCPSVLPKLLVPGPSPEARKAAAAAIGRVRIGDGSAFVLFKPAGGKLSYFVLQEEDGSWKATGLSAGTPLSP